MKASNEGILFLLKSLKTHIYPKDFITHTLESEERSSYQDYEILYSYCATPLCCRKSPVIKIRIKLDALKPTIPLNYTIYPWHLTYKCGTQSASIAHAQQLKM